MNVRADLLGVLLIPTANTWNHLYTAPAGFRAKLMTLTWHVSGTTQTVQFRIAKGTDEARIVRVVTGTDEVGQAKDLSIVIDENWDLDCRTTGGNVYVSAHGYVLELP